uniref:TLC domain containing 2 n=1 Tax=Acanthochromis polyacanthus TaxID=80966 RepID=A0A3Q1FET8_9TELE
MDLRSTLLLIGGSACSFKLLNTVVGFLPTPEPARSKAWKWRNISTSLAHSSLTGAGAVLCFYLQPHMAEDLISSCSLLSHSLVAASTGYFIHDFLDMTLNEPLRKSWELLLHHSVVISCFSLAAASRLYVGFALVSLLVEINSVFLHIRQSGPEIASPRPSLAFSITSWLNLGTFLVFRGFTLGWMSRWLACHSEHMPRYVLMMGTAGLTLVSIMNAALFYKLLRADILRNTSKASNNH